MSYKISSKDFVRMHNAVCGIYHTKQQLASVLSAGLIKELEQYIEVLESITHPILEIEEKEEEKRREHYDEVQKSLSLSSQWSISSVKNLYDKHPYKKATHVSYTNYGTTNTHWAKIGGKKWSDLFIAADIARVMTGDMHHIFIEGFNASKDGKILALTTGS